MLDSVDVIKVGDGEDEGDNDTEAAEDWGTLDGEDDDDDARSDSTSSSLAAAAEMVKATRVTTVHRNIAIVIRLYIRVRSTMIPKIVEPRRPATMNAHPTHPTCSGVMTWVSS